MPPGKAKEPFPVFPENRAAVDLFLWCETQWRRAGMDGAVVGLDYLTLMEIARVVGTPMTPKVLRQIKIMEMNAMRVFTSRAASQTAEHREMAHE
ncbi:MAG: DUF1799 domain-containing protein [Alphaproteobacteria bacterium]|nr:DUF1799 domain-containing protein [Alphaproteobacteria bacterium]